MRSKKKIDITKVNQDISNLLKSKKIFCLTRIYPSMSTDIELLINQYDNYHLSDVIDYDKFNNYAIVHHSATIEGSTLTEIETRLLLDENLTPKGKPLEHSLMTKDHFDALKFTLDTAKSRRSISAQLIQEINSLILKNTGGIYNTVFGTIDASKGIFRKGNVSAGDSYFVNFDKVEGLVKDLSNQLNTQLENNKTKIENLETSFNAHFQLVTIHPFYDGNGRTSRLLMNYIQKINNLPLAIVFTEDKVEYFEALQQTRKKDDINILKNLCIVNMKSTLKMRLKNIWLFFQNERK